MTVWQLSVYIGAAILFQVAIGAGVFIWRRSASAANSSQVNEPIPSVSSSLAWPGLREFRVMRRSFEDAAKTQCSFYLEPVDGAPLPAFKPGQYLTFSLEVGEPSAHSGNARRNLTRCYSLSDQPDSRQYRITIKRMPAPSDRPTLPPGASSNHFHDHVREGVILNVRAPSGHFTIDANSDVNQPAVFIAGGIGITPMMSMLRWTVATHPQRMLHLFYGVRNGADHAFKTPLEELARSHPAFKLHVVYSNPLAEDIEGQDYERAGYIDLEMLRQSLPHGRHQFYVCGPPPMMQILVPALRDWGVSENDIHFEAFGPASAALAAPATNEPAAVSATSLSVRFNRSGRSLVWDGQDASLLDFAERQGVRVESGCRTGSCGTCETKLISGYVQYASPPDYEIANGHCLLCVSKPQSELVLEA